MARTPRYPIVETILDFLFPQRRQTARQHTTSSSAAALSPLPVTVQNVRPALPVSATGTRPQPQARVDNASIVLGTDIQTGQKVTISLKELLQSLYGIGTTGSGKSTLLLNMILSHIRLKRGVCLIEPHGDGTKQLIAAMPEERLKDVIYLDITDSTASFSLNFFECPAGADLTEVAKIASFVMHVFEKVWQVGPETPRLAQVLRNTTRLLIENPGMTFAEIPLLLWEDGVREKLVRRVTNTQTKLFWSQYNRKDPRAREELISSTINKCDAYLNEPLIARIVSQAASTIDFRRIMDEGKILLVNLSPQLEEASRLIGAVLIGRLLMAAFSRTDTPEEQRRPFLLYCDEYQRFATADFATLLAEARKFKISTNLFNQTLEQLDDANRAAALQVGTLLCFRVSGEDSKILSKSFDATPGIEQIGVEPQRAPVADVISHLVHRGHTDYRVTAFAQTYLSSLEHYCNTKAHERFAASYDCFDGSLLLTDQQVQQARKLLNDCLFRSMSEKSAAITIPAIALYVLTTAQAQKIEYIFSPYLKTTTTVLFGPHELLAFQEGMAVFGKPAFLRNHAERFVREQRKGHRWLAEAVVSLLTELAYTLSVLAEHPVLIDTGQYIPQYRQRTYIDQENLIANELSQLPNYHAKVQLLTTEYSILTNPPPPLVSEREVHERIRTIKERMLRDGVTRPAAAIEEEVRKRHEALRERPAAVLPPTRTSGTRRSRTKPPAQP
jgi:hypothetical protein